MATRLKVEGDRKVRDELGGLKNATQNPGPHLDKARPFYESSVKRNFRDGGRPEKWEPKADGSPSHLMDTRLMVAGINSKREGNTIVIGSPRIQSSVHNFGETITFKTRPISIKMPKREFMIIVPEDQEVGAQIQADSMAQAAGIK